LGIEEASTKAAALIKSQSYQLTMAYLDGINQYLDDGKTPIEFSLVGIKKQSLLLRMSTIFLDTCLLVLRWRKNQTLTY
jgi:penicillin amidase